MHGKIRRSLADAAKASTWRDRLWAGDHFERERERERESEDEIEREGLREWVGRWG